jgi:hypothetical protein
LSGNTLHIPLPQKTIAAGSASWKIPLALWMIGMLSRWPLRGRLLYDQTSAALAFAARDGELPGGAALPHTGALYIALGRQLIALFGSPELAFVAISVVASGLAVAAIYLLGAALFGEIAGVLAAVLLLSSPLFWFYGAVGLPYAPDTLIAVVAAWLSWRILCGHGRVFLPLMLGLAFTAGFRPWPVVLMLPLALFAAVQAVRINALRPAQVAGLCFASVLLGAIWFLPIGRLPGAPPALADVVAPGVDARDLALMIGWGWGLAMLPALGVLPLWALRIPGFRTGFGRWSWLHDQRVQFFAAWGLPWLLFALLIRGEALGQPAVGLPMLLLWSGGALALFIGAGARRMATIAATLIILGNAALFLVTPEQRMVGAHRAPSAATIFYRDRRLAAAIVAIGGFSPSETVILADDWLPVMYYLPKYPLIVFRPPDAQASVQASLSAQQIELAREAAALVWFESTLDRYNSSPSQTEIQSIAIGTLRMLRPQPAEEVIVGEHAFGLRIKPERR